MANLPAGRQVNINNQETRNKHQDEVQYLLKK
jgi:hypothetical protein